MGNETGLAKKPGPMDTAINKLAAKPNDCMLVFGELFGRYADAISEISEGQINALQAKRSVALSMSKNTKLASCTPRGIIMAVMQAAEVKLHVGVAKAEAYLVPYFNSKTQVSDCVLIPGYQGLINIHYRSPHVGSLFADAVFEGDDFEYGLGTEPFIRHKRGDGPGDAKHLTHVYAIAELVRSRKPLIRVLNRAEIEAYRNRSAAKASGPWITDYIPMCLKTGLKRLVPMLPYEPDASKVLALDDAADTGDPTFLEELEASVEEKPEEAAQTVDAKLSAPKEEGTKEATGGTATRDQLARITALCVVAGDISPENAQSYLERYHGLDCPLAEMRRDAADAMLGALTGQQAPLAEET